MDPDERRRRRFAFEAAAERYDRARPRYPEALYDDLMGLGRLLQGDQVLEIGAGTGIATAGLVVRGLKVTAIEPGPAMRRVGEAKLGDRVRWIGQPFEEVTPRPYFAAVVVAQAFHWIDPRDRLARVAGMLRPRGVFAFVQHVQATDCPWRRRAEPVFRRVLGDRRPAPTTTRPFIWQELVASPAFLDLELHEYPRVQTYTSEAIVALVNTQSDVLTLPDSPRNALLRGLAESVESQGGTTTVHWVAQLLLATT